jgi:hypothetical protein
VCARESVWYVPVATHVMPVDIGNDHLGEVHRHVPSSTGNPHYENRQHLDLWSPKMIRQPLNVRHLTRDLAAQLALSLSLSLITPKLIDRQSSIRQWVKGIHHTTNC